MAYGVLYRAYSDVMKEEDAGVVVAYGDVKVKIHVIFFSIPVLC
jgi:hypothetical protein